MGVLFPASYTGQVGTIFAYLPDASIKIFDGEELEARNAHNKKLLLFFENELRFLSIWIPVWKPVCCDIFLYEVTDEQFRSSRSYFVHFCIVKMQ